MGRGGPQLPNTDGMSVAEKKLTLNAFHEKNPNFTKERRRIVCHAGIQQRCGVGNTRRI